MKFDIGPGIKCDLDDLIVSRWLIQANSGGGKSWLLRRILEQTFDSVQQIVIDPEGEFKSLREKYGYILAAKGEGETTVDARHVRLLARRLRELRASLILDISELKAHERVAYVRRFLEELVELPQRLWQHPVLVVVDEAHVYCPQQGSAESSGAVIDLMTRGRKRGLCGILATQRLAKLHKDAAAEANNKAIGRSLEIDAKRAADELGFPGREGWHQLRGLAPGMFYVYGPALTPEVKQVMVGPVETAHPRVGQRIALAAPPTPASVKKLLPQLEDLPAESEQEKQTMTRSGRK